MLLDWSFLLLLLLLALPGVTLTACIRPGGHTQAS